MNIDLKAILTILSILVGAGGYILRGYLQGRRGIPSGRDLLMAVVVGLILTMILFPIISLILLAVAMP